MRNNLRIILGLNQLKETNRAKFKVHKSRQSDLMMIINLKLEICKRDGEEK